MNKKTTKLIISILVFLGVFGFNFIKGQLSDNKDNVSPSSTSSVSKETENSTETKDPSKSNETEKKDFASSENESDEDEEDDDSSNSDDKNAKAESIDDLVRLGLLEEIQKNGKVVGWESKAGLFYGMGSKEGNRVKHVFEHLKPNPNKPIHSVFDTDKAGLIELIDEAWNNRDGAYTKAQSNGNRIYDIDMGREIGTNGEYIIRIVVRDGSEKIITAYPKK